MEADAYDVLLGLLRLALWGDDSVRRRLPLTPDEWKAVQACAGEQSLVGVAFDGLNRLPREERPPQEQWLRWWGTVQRIERRSSEMNRLAADLTTRLSARLPHAPVLLKGQGAARHWPEPMHRLSGDIDLLVGEEGWNYLLAGERAGKITLDAERGHHLSMKCGNICVEFHRHTTHSYSARQQRHWERLERERLGGETPVVVLPEGGAVHVPPPDFDALFLFYHAYFHLLHHGVGLRPLLDWALLFDKESARIDGARLLRETDALGLTPALGAFGYVAVHGLGLPADRLPFDTSPYRAGGEWLLDDIRCGGSFGKKRLAALSGRRGTWSGEWAVLTAALRRSRSMGNLLGAEARWFPWLRSLHHARKILQKGLGKPARFLTFVGKKK